MSFTRPAVVASHRLGQTRIDRPPWLPQLQRRDASKKGSDGPVVREIASAPKQTVSFVNHVERDTALARSNRRQIITNFSKVGRGVSSNHHMKALRMFKAPSTRNLELLPVASSAEPDLDTATSALHASDRVVCRVLPSRYAVARCPVKAGSQHSTNCALGVSQCPERTTARQRWLCCARVV